MKRPSEFLHLRFRQAFMASRNPYYAWAALRLCTDRKPLPSWLAAYLVQCSERMLSEKAEQASDLREILPWVLGFPAKRAKKRFHDKISLKMWKFATEFGVRILRDEDPVTARHNACNAAFDSKDDDVDDKTLKRWPLQAFLLKKAPKGARQWKEIVLRFAAVMDQFAKMEMTSAEAAKAGEISRDSGLGRRAKSLLLQREAVGGRDMSRRRTRKPPRKPDGHRQRTANIPGYKTELQVAEELGHVRGAAADRMSRSGRLRRGESEKRKCSCERADRSGALRGARLAKWDCRKACCRSCRLAFDQIVGLGRVPLGDDDGEIVGLGIDLYALYAFAGLVHRLKYATDFADKGKGSIRRHDCLRLLSSTQVIL